MQPSTARARPALRRLSTLAALAAAVAGSLVIGPTAPARATDSYHALSPARILDTRNGVGASGKVGAGQAITLDVTGAGGVPARGVAAVVLNVTATNATAATFVTVWPTGQTKPNTSNLNVQPGVDTPNAVIATVGADGTIQLANEFGEVDLLADVSGWIPAGAEYRALTPARILDTRVGTGAAATPVGPSGRIDVDVTGVGGVPATGVAAVVLNVTAVQATAPTYVTAWPAGQPQPNTSNLNVQPNVDTPNLVIATVGADGKVSLANQFGSTHLIADVAGYFTAGTGYTALSPARVLDTRQSIGAAGPVGSGAAIDVEVTGRAGVPASGVSAVVLNVTAAQASDSTYVTVWPAGYPKPEASSLNVQPNVDTPNLVIATVGADGKVSLANQFGSTHLIADVAGYFTGAPPTNPADPGTLWAGGNGSIWRYELADPAAGWVDRGTFGEAFTVDADRHQLVDIDSDPFDPTVVQVRDLATNAVAEEFVWDTPAWGVSDIEASPDGRYLVAIMEYGAVDSGVEILRRSDHSVVDLGLHNVYDIEFAPTGDLLIAVDRSDEENPPHNSAIGVVPAADLGAAVEGYYAIAEFGPAQGLPGGLAVSADGQLLFNRSGALWAVTLAPDGTGPRQLTTGPEGAQGGAFSPDATQIAFVLPSIAAAYQRQYVIPNHAGEPLYVDPADGAGDQYLIDQDNLVRYVVAWLP